MSEFETTEKETIVLRTALGWGISSAVVNLVFTLFLSFWLGEPVDIGLVVMTSILLGLMNGGCTGQFITPYRLKAIHWLGVAAIAVPLGYVGSFFFELPFASAALSYSVAFVWAGIPAGYAIMKYVASRPVAPAGHPDNID